MLNNKARVIEMVPKKDKNEIIIRVHFHICLYIYYCDPLCLYWSRSILNSYLIWIFRILWIWLSQHLIQAWKKSWVSLFHICTSFRNRWVSGYLRIIWLCFSFCWRRSIKKTKKNKMFFFFSLVVVSLSISSSSLLLLL